MRTPDLPLRPCDFGSVGLARCSDTLAGRIGIGVRCGVGQCDAGDGGATAGGAESAAPSSARRWGGGWVLGRGVALRFGAARRSGMVNHSRINMGTRSPKWSTIWESVAVQRSTIRESPWESDPLNGQPFGNRSPFNDQPFANHHGNSISQMVNHLGTAHRRMVNHSRINMGTRSPKWSTIWKSPWEVDPLNGQHWVSGNHGYR